MMKAPTGIAGLDEITGGGLPRGRTTLVAGGPGSGKTVMALQSLVHGAREGGEPGIFVAFEEQSRIIVANGDRFGWDVSSLEQERLFYLDAQPDPDLLRSGEFDIVGMLAGLETQVESMGAKRIAFDAIDIVLALMPDNASVRREIYRLHDWLLAHDLTALITGKRRSNDSPDSSFPPLEFMQFMVDCSIGLDHELVDGVSQRSIRVQKYRGSSFEENATPFFIGPTGIEVAFTYGQQRDRTPATSERISSGVERLDEMLSGGYFRGASVLLTGAPGTSKTTLAGSFTLAACERGEKTLFVSFDSHGSEIVRNLASVSIDLAPHTGDGLLRLVSMRALSGSAEIHLMRIKALVREHDARCVVIDPLSALSKTGNRGMAPSVAERLIDWGKAEGLTILCTSLVDDGSNGPAEGTPLQISTIADTWIHLSYVVHAGERNRGLSIVKSRGTSHSNQVRELVLGATGVTLTDVYTAGGEVLMGTLRWTKERADKIAAQERVASSERERAKLRAETARIEAQIELLRNQLASNQEEQDFLARREDAHFEQDAGTEDQLRARRGGATTDGDDGDRDDR